MVLNPFRLCQHSILVDRFNGNLHIKSLNWEVNHWLPSNRTSVPQLMETGRRKSSDVFLSISRPLHRLICANKPSPTIQSLVAITC